jgi:DNA (cytosine-5)-methyltransferase 1
MKYTCVDSFCGAGGLALGLKQAGFDLLFSFDLDAKCIDTIKANKKYFGQTAKQADITDMLNGKLLNECGLKRGELFLLAGGPPCQGFSVQRRGDDVDPRNQLVLKYGQLIEELYPRYFVMENVSGLGGKRGKTILQELIESAENAGYTVHVQLLDAEDYGVPQRRKRYIIVGERKDMGTHYEYPEPSKNRKTVRETIGMLPEPPLDGTDYPGIPLHRRDKLSALNLRRINALKEGQGRDDLPEELLADCHKVSSDVIGYRNVYGRMAWDEVAPTITARFDSFTRGQFGHPDQARSISLREGALLQTFPMDFNFIGNKVDVARQIGNAVPPQLAKVIGQSIIKCYERAEADKWDMTQQ